MCELFFFGPHAIHCLYFDLPTMAVKEKLDASEEFDWNVENEIQLFFAMNGHKPVGKRLTKSISKLIEPKG